MLTDKQNRILNHISNVIKSTGQAPTIAEIGRQFQMRSSASVHAVLAILEREGHIERTPNIARGIKIVVVPPSGLKP